MVIILSPPIKYTCRITTMYFNFLLRSYIRNTKPLLSKYKLDCTNYLDMVVASYSERYYQMCFLSFNCSQSKYFEQCFISALIVSDK